MAEPGRPVTPGQKAAFAIEREAMIDPGDRVLVAFSGGADSSALALLLQDLGHQVVLGHVDHGIRPESGNEAEHCRLVARQLHLRFVSRRVKVDPPTQAEARRVRYAALEEMADAVGATRIATGHTLDDQAETVRLRLDRGGYGLGIPPVRGRIVRPLLGLRRSETEQVCRSMDICFLLDPSNRNPKYRRVAVRAELADQPQETTLELAALAAASRSETLEVAGRAEELWPRITCRLPAGVRMQREALRRAGEPLATHLVRRAATELDIELSGRAVRDIVRKVLPVTGARLALPGGRSVWSERDHVVFGWYEEDAVLPELKVSIPGKVCAGDWGMELRAEPAALPVAFSRRPRRCTELVDASLVGPELTVRQWRPGDRFHPLGAPGTRKLQDYFTDTGVPRHRRSTVPVVEAGNRIVWVAGHRLDDRFKIRPSTTRVLRLTMTPVSRADVA